MTNSPTDRYYLNVFRGLADLQELPSIFWSVSLQPLVADQATIQPIEGDMYIFHMRHISIMWYMRLQSNQSHTWLSIIGLVLSTTDVQPWEHTQARCYIWPEDFARTHIFERRDHLRHEIIQRGAKIFKHV